MYLPKTHNFASSLNSLYTAESAQFYSAFSPTTISLTPRFHPWIFLLKLFMSASKLRFLKSIAKIFNRNKYLKNMYITLLYTVLILSNQGQLSPRLVEISPLVTIIFFSWFSQWKVKEKIQLGVKKSNLEFCSRYLNLSQRYWRFHFFRFFGQCTFIYSYRFAIFGQCVVQIIRNSDLLKVLSYLVWFLR